MLHFYETLYEILFFISFLGLIVGMFDPGIVVPWCRKKNRLRVFLIFGLASIILLILIRVVSSIRNDQKRMLILKSTGVLTKLDVTRQDQGKSKK